MPVSMSMPTIEPARPRPRPTIVPPPRRRPPHVLLAEDDPQLRRLVGDALRERGLVVLEVASGGGLLQTLGSCLLGELRPPDLVLSDQRMPGTTGLEVLEGLRRARWELPFVLFTAFGDPALLERAARLGATVVDKPCDVDDLAELVARRCDGTTTLDTRPPAGRAWPDLFSAPPGPDDDEEEEDA